MPSRAHGVTAMTRIPTIKVVMTPFPYSVDAMEDVRTAHGMMAQQGIRHLPVTRERKIVGIVSERDIFIADAVLGQRTGEIGVPVWSVCTREPYVVDIDAQVDKVADEMANRHIGSALVTKNDKLAGIVTTTDICRAYADLVRERWSPGGDVA